MGFRGVKKMSNLKETVDLMYVFIIILGLLIYNLSIQISNLKQECYKPEYLEALEQQKIALEKRRIEKLNRISWKFPWPSFLRFNK